MASISASACCFAFSAALTQSGACCSTRSKRSGTATRCGSSLGGGAIFAAWPPLYATAFSGFYVAMFLVLAALILRPVGFMFRSKLTDSPMARHLGLGAVRRRRVPALVFGVAFGNVLLGVPFRFDDTLRVTYEGGFFGLLNPFGLLAARQRRDAGDARGGVCAMQDGRAAVERAATPPASRPSPTILLFSLGGVAIAASDRRLPDHVQHRSGRRFQSAAQGSRARGRAAGSPITALIRGCCWHPCWPSPVPLGALLLRARAATARIRRERHRRSRYRSRPSASARFRSCCPQLVTRMPASRSGMPAAARRRCSSC